MPSEREIEACVRALATLSKSKHVIDELRGAVWEYFLTNPTSPCTPTNKRLRSFLASTLQLKSAHTDVSDTLTDDSGNTYSLIDLVTGDDTTPEAILIERQTPAPEYDLETAKTRYMDKRHMMTWRQEAMFQMQAAGISCARIALYFGMTVKSVYMEMYTARERIKNIETIQKGIPDTAVISLQPICVGSLTLKRLPR